MHLGLLLHHQEDMAPPTKTAAKTAAKTSTKPVLQPLQTPKTSTFPSEEIPRAHPSKADSKADEEKSLLSPITPPVAYTEFLKAMTPIFHSPVSPAMSFSRCLPIERLPVSATSVSQPSTATSVSFPEDVDFVKSETISPESPPPSAKSVGGRKRLRISTAKAAARKGVDSPRSAAASCSPFSPADWKVRYFDGPRQSTGKSVSIRQVVTRTVTYRQTSLEPAPKGKRRRTSVTPQA